MRAWSPLLAGCLVVALGAACGGASERPDASVDGRLSGAGGTGGMAPATGGTGGRDGGADVPMDLAADDGASTVDGGDVASDAPEDGADASDGAVPFDPNCGANHQLCCAMSYCRDPKTACWSGHPGYGHFCDDCGVLGKPCCGWKDCNDGLVCVKTVPYGRIICALPDAGMSDAGASDAELPDSAGD